MHIYTVPMTDINYIYNWPYGFIVPFVLHVIIELFEVHDNDILREILFVAVSTDECWIKPI